MLRGIWGLLGSELGELARRVKLAVTVLTSRVKYSLLRVSFWSARVDWALVKWGKWKRRRMKKKKMKRGRRNEKREKKEEEELE